MDNKIQIDDLNIYDKQHTQKWLAAAYYQPNDTLQHIKNERNDINIDDLDPRPDLPVELL